MRWLVLGCLALVACGEPAGLTLVIETPPGTESVRVFLGDRPCLIGDQDCRSIQPPMFATRRDGDGYFMDADASAEYSLTGNDELVLRLTSNVAGDRLAQQLVFVGIGSGGTPTGSYALEQVTIPANAAVVFKIVLAPYDPPHDPVGPTVDGDHVLYWPRKDAGNAGCVLVQRVRGGAATYAFVVPEGDTDCDDLPPALECRALWSLAPPVPGQLPTCVTPNAARHGACVLAGPQCAETGAGASPCAPLDQHYCLADQICADCGAPGQLGGCATTLFQRVNAGGSAIPHEAIVFSTTNFGVCTTGNLSHVTFDVSTLLAAAGGEPACKRVGIHDLGATFPDLPLFKDTAMVTFLNPAAGPGVTMKVSLTGDDPCTVDLKWVSGVLSSTMASSFGLLLLDVQTETGHLIVPLRLGFEEDATCQGGLSPPAPVIPVLPTSAPFRQCLSSQ